ncbi:NCS2 family permease [Ureibacillus chungkukjangi]|uniref:AGZA family xanthine/uracil permease-like MFS transporter n=1 Tax=Ureibacillus chungkukjangi TaxID=1202712 RepID=A0A318TMV6_9BACL|nr:NCS2 family permease [Ureibacillus chungkukjangi]MCM3389468.1 NCS2 family permease [Ureibacillus chungkukjangi]PYF04348.1 AGZA family xanthine/uracil permease-like MFS transporter [Ureibacillus chungkukjangi]
MKKYFQFEELGTNYRREILGGLTTFLSMAYILAVNPGMLEAAGMDYNAVFVATALAAAVGCLFMGLIAKYPIALAPGMGLNAFFTFSVVMGMGMAWETALTGVMFSGIVFIVLSLSGIRETIINAIPAQLKYAVGAGIGLFITFVGFQGAGIIVNDDATLTVLGDITSGNALLAVFGIFVTAIFMAKKINGGIFYGMVITAIAGMIFGLVNMPEKIVSSIPSLEPTFGAAFDFLGNFDVIWNLDFLIVVLTFLFVDFFDTAGTLMAVAGQAGLVKDNKLPRAGRALLADSLATVTGAIFGTSTTTSYVESTAGVAAGARSGLAAVVTGILFLLALFFSPVLAVVTSAVTAPALIIVGALMVSSLKLIEWDKIEIAIPAFLVMICMPLGYSIATGIAIGFIFYPITMLVSGRGKEVHPIMYGLFVIFLCYFIFL